MVVVVSKFVLSTRSRVYFVSSFRQYAGVCQLVLTFDEADHGWIENKLTHAEKKKKSCFCLFFTKRIRLTRLVHSIQDGWSVLVARNLEPRSVKHYAHARYVFRKKKKFIIFRYHWSLCLNNTVVSVKRGSQCFSLWTPTNSPKCPF